MAAGTDTDAEVDSAGVYFISVAEFESRSEPEADRTDPAGPARRPVDGETGGGSTYCGVSETKPGPGRS